MTLWHLAESASVMQGPLVASVINLRQVEASPKLSCYPYYLMHLCKLPKMFKMFKAVKVFKLIKMHKPVRTLKPVNVI